MRQVRRLFPILIASTACLAAGSSSYAQNSSLFGSRGPLSQASAGGVLSNSSNGTAFGGMSAGYGTAGMGSSAFGQSGNSFGQSGSGFGQNGGAQGQFGTFGTVTAPTINSTMGRTSGAAARVSALGAAGQNQGLGQNQLGRNGTGLGNGLNGLNRNGQNRAGQQRDDGQNGNEPPAIVRVRPQVAFVVPPRQIEVVNTSIQTRFDRISRRGPEFGNIQFDIGGSGDVTLRGTIPTESTGRLAAALVRLEPGVRSVRNELSLVPPPRPVE